MNKEMLESFHQTTNGKLYYKTNFRLDAAALVLMATGGSPRGSKSLSWTNLPIFFARKNIASMVFDFSGQGFSEGDRRVLTISKGVENLEDMLSFIAADVNYSSMPLFILGSSYGGNVILEYLSRDVKHNIRGACLKSPCIDLKESYHQDLGHEGMSSWKETGFSDFAGLNWEVMEDSDQLNLTNRLGNITHPMLIVHGTTDESVPIYQTRKVLERSSGKVHLLEMNPSNHHYSSDNDWDIMASTMSTWVEMQIKDKDE